MATITETPFFSETLRICQPERGYRFNVDSLLLSAFVLRHEPVAVPFVELGAGCGVVSLLLARGGLRDGMALELQADMVACAQQTFRANGLRRVTCVQVDIRHLADSLKPGSASVVVTNPPYFPVGRGMLSVDPVEANARHELTCTMADVLSAMRYLLPPGGRGYVVYPVDRLPELMASLPGFKLTCMELQCVHPSAGKPAANVLVRLEKSGKKLMQIAPPLFTHGEDGEYTEWYEELGRRMKKG